MDDLWRSAYQFISRRAMTCDEFLLQVIASVSELNEREALALGELFLNGISRTGGEG